MKDIDKTLDPKKYFYSPSTKGFYLGGFHRLIPADRIEISQEKHAALLEGQSSGKVISHDGTNVILQDPPPVDPTPGLRARRNRALTETDAFVARHRDQVETGITPTLNASTYTALLRYRQALRDLPAANGFPNVDFPKSPLEL